MRDDKDHNERLDDFSGYMRQRLEEHRLPDRKSTRLNSSHRT